MSTVKIKVTRLANIQKIVLLVFIILGTHGANAQLREFESMYFQNQYLANPAMAARESGAIVANIGYQREFNSFPGAPVLGYATFEYNLGNRMGIGLNANNDKAGLIDRTSILATYAYHLPIGDNEQKLDFGLSLGGNFASIDQNKTIGSIDDVNLQSFKDSGLDGNFGIAYTSQLWTIQASLPNLNTLLFDSNNGIKKYVDIPLFYSAISYKILGPMYNVDLEPILAYRGVKGYKDIVDAGFRLNMLKYDINFSGFYHSNNSISAAFGMILIDKLGVFLSYSNYNGNAGYKNNTLEFGLSYKFSK